MGYNIRKATGRKTSDNLGAGQKSSNLALRFKDDAGVEPKVDLFKTDLDSKLALFQTIVSHGYLTELSDSKLLAPINEKLPGMNWYKITKIVLDDDTFFPDLLSMLYTALHGIAKNVALVVKKNNFDDFEIFLGARDFQGVNQDASSLLSTAIQGYLPGVKTEYAVDKRFFQNPKSDIYVASCSGVASLRDDRKENFVQGIEKFIDATPSIPSYTAIFIADNIGDKQAADITKAYSSLHDAFSPMIQWQETMSESDTAGVTESIAKTIGRTITDTLSETVTRTEGTNQSYQTTKGTSITEGKSSSSGFAFLASESESESLSNTEMKQSSEQSGRHSDTSKGNSKSSATANSVQDTTSKSTSQSKTSGKSKQITRSCAQTKHYVDIIERNIERIYSGMPFGLWSVSTYFVSPDSSTSLKLANVYRGCITGENTDIDAVAINLWDKSDSETILKYLKETQHPKFLVGGIQVTPGSLVTSKELAINMSLPQKSIPGVEVRNCASFGRNINVKDNNNQLRLGQISHLGNVSNSVVALDTDELCKHVFVTGSTGSGKSNTVYLMIDKLLLLNKPVLIIEPKKGDYKKVFGGRKDMKVYSTRYNDKCLLKINPFAFPEGIHVVEHVERLVEIFGVCWPMYAAMPAVLKNSILSAYEACGWNLKTSTCRYEELFPTIADVVIELKHIIKSSQYSADTKGDYIGALQTRLESLTNGTYSSILCSPDTTSYSNLYDKNAIVDLHYVGSSETRSLLMGLLVLGLTEWRMTQNEDEMDRGLQHVTILEEAHNILPRVLKHQSQESANVVGKSVEMLASAIAEMRTYGECFIIVDQTPSAVDESAIRNTNTKIVMNLPEKDDREVAGRSVALTKDEQIDELARLGTGEAVVWQRGWSEAVLAKIDYKDPSTYRPKKNSQIGFNDIDPYKPSADFISFFVCGDNSLNDKQIKTINIEVLIADCPSSIKATLLDALRNRQSVAPTKLDEATVCYLGLKDKILQLFDLYPQGSKALIEDLRIYMANNLELFDTKAQNCILSKLFKWASAQSQKWLRICINSKNV